MFEDLGTNDKNVAVYRAFMSGVQGRDGFGEAVQFAQQMNEVNKAKAVEADSRGFMADVLAGERDFPGLASRYKRADPRIMQGFLADMLQEEQFQRRAAQQEQTAIRAEGRAQAGQAEDEQRKRDAANQDAAGFLAAAGAAENFGGSGTGLDPEEMRIAAAEGVDGIRPVDVFGYRADQQKQLNATSANDAREARTQALVDKAELQAKTRSDTQAYFDRLRAVGMDPSKADSSDLSNVDPSLLRQLIANAGAEKRQNTALTNVPAGTQATIAAGKDKADQAAALQAWKAAGAPLTARDKADTKRLEQLRTLYNGAAKGDPKIYAEAIAGYKAELKEIAARKAELVAWQEQGKQFGGAK